MLRGGPGRSAGFNASMQAEERFARPLSPDDQLEGCEEALVDAQATAHRRPIDSTDRRARGIERTQAGRRSMPDAERDGDAFDVMGWAEHVARMALLNNVHLSMRDLERMHEERQFSPYAELDDGEFGALIWAEHAARMALLHAAPVSMRDIEAELADVPESHRRSWSGRCSSRHGAPRTPSTRPMCGPCGRRG